MVSVIIFSDSRLTRDCSTLVTGKKKKDMGGYGGGGEENYR